MKSLNLSKQYEFREVKSSSFDMKFRYPVYSVYPRIELIRPATDASDHLTHVRTETINKSAPRILLIDENEDMIFTFESFLAGEGYQVASFSDPEKAVAHFADVAPNYYKLVILDIKMPGIDGLEVHRRLANFDPDLKVLFVSAPDSADEM